MKKIKFVENEDLNYFFNSLYFNIDNFIINYINEIDDIGLFIEGLENIDCYNQQDKEASITFYYIYKNKYNIKHKLAMFLSDRFSIDFVFDDIGESREYFENEIKEFFQMYLYI